jgi:predicted amidohydrolase
LYQFSPALGQVGRNLADVVSALAEVNANPIVLPELSFTGYRLRNRQEVAALSRDPRRSHTVDTLTALCLERDLYLVTGFPERHLDRCFTSALLIGPQGVPHTFRKLHLFAGEKRCFDPGDTPLVATCVRVLVVGPMIWFDWAFPYGCTRPGPRRRRRALPPCWPGADLLPADHARTVHREPGLRCDGQPLRRRYTPPR